MKYGSIIAIFLLVSCTKNHSPVSIQTDEIIENGNPGIDTNMPPEQEEQTAVSDIKGNKNIGIYFPQYYIENLIETKSHVAASDQLYRLDNNNAIIIFENEVIYIYNFHEGVNAKISNISNDEIFTEGHYNEGRRLYIIDDDTVKNENRMVFKRINTNIDEWRSQLNSFITKTIFGNKTYKNAAGEEIYRNENGKIFSNNIEYDIHVDTVFSNKEYDSLRAVQGNDKIFFKFKNDILEIYRQEIPEEYYGDPMQEKYAVYFFMDEYRH
jgi:hypothetical protein